jgi:MinD superfamily P-loop ATPase
MTRALDKPFAVIINRHDIGDEGVVNYCKDENIPMMMNIPHNRRIAEAYAQGNLIIEIDEKHRRMFEQAVQNIAPWRQTSMEKDAGRSIVKAKKAAS